MRLRNLFVAVAAATAMGAAHGATITNSDGSFSFGGFDWSQEGAGWVVGYDILNTSPAGTTDTFTLYYQATATALKDANGVNYVPTGMRPNGTDYEYTIFATVQEAATCVDLPGGATCDAVLFTVLGGNYDIYYDTTVDANYAAGTGFRNGTEIIGGVITGGSPVLAPQGASNPGNASVNPTLYGTVSIQNFTYVVPSLYTTTASTTLQFGTTITQPWTRPAAFDGIGPTGPNTNTSYVGQADANQSFFAVPEPASLALVGLGLAIAGFSSRRRNG